ncbi:MAG: gliding motility-associated C-terminal domain-containing protein [Bacteroidetes bacterium]|nr:gliding motility-associated C-terminal domain-containing protein [Bacteroidota bacterium]
MKEEKTQRHSGTEKKTKVNLFSVSLCLRVFIFWGSIGILQPNLILSQTTSEICNNGIDDDKDGLIDLNDGDCDCQYIEPVFSIPNPSFEEKSCCPVGSGRMECVDDWVKSSVTTPDFINLCGFQGFNLVPMPKPIPDGEGCVGFFNGYSGPGDSRPTWKEYVGVCLDVPLLAGVTYTFEFYVGFSEEPYSPGFKLSFFGTHTCDYLPFEYNNQEFGCPSNSVRWTTLSSVDVEGTNEWVLAQMTITPHDDVYALVIGPACPLVVRDYSSYYFFDHITLVNQSSDPFDIQANGNPCGDQFSLSVADAPIFDYQWFKDGIALVGENEARLTPNPKYGPGIYQVMMTDSVECQISREYIHELPVFSGMKNLAICQGDAYSFNNQALTAPGIYIDTLKTADQCDSILTLNLEVVEGFRTQVEAKIFPGETYQVGGQTFDQEGKYDIMLLSQAGCDSLVLLTLSLYDAYLPSAFTPNGDGINDIFIVMGGEDLVLIKNLSVFNRWGNLVYTATDIRANDLTQGWDGRTIHGPGAEGVYIFVAQLVYDDGKARDVSGSVTLIR